MERPQLSTGVLNLLQLALVQTSGTQAGYRVQAQDGNNDDGGLEDDVHLVWFKGGLGWVRTTDTRIFNPVLCH